MSDCPAYKKTAANDPVINRAATREVNLLAVTFKAGRLIRLIMLNSELDYHSN